MNYNKLCGRIIEKFKSRMAFAKVAGISASSLSMKLNGNSAVTTDDIVRWSNLLGIDNADIGEYFFTLEVQED